MRRNPGVAGPNAFAQALRHSLVPDPFLASPVQWGHVAGIHGSYSSTLSAAASAGATSVSLSAACSVNDYLAIGSFSSTLSSAAAQGASSLSLAAAPALGMFLLVGTSPFTFGVTVSGAPTGSGPYNVPITPSLPCAFPSGATVVLAPPPLKVWSISGTTAYLVPTGSSGAGPLPYAVASGAAVKAIHTVDVYLDASAGNYANAATGPSPNTAFLTTGIPYLSSYTPASGDYVAVLRSHMSSGGGSDRFVFGKLA